MADDLALAFDLIARGDMAGEISEPTPFGTMVSSPGLPRRYDSNYYLVGALAPDVEAGTLAADAERAHAALGLEQRAVMVRDRATGERLAPGFAALGWEVERFLVMAHRREPEREVDTSIVAEVALDRLTTAREEQLLTYPWGTPELARTLAEAKRRIPFETRFFAVLADGEVVSYSDLYRDGAVAQVEDVATLEPHRGRGYASAVVFRAVEEARRSGATLVFLVADAEDWPQQLYRRLGFDELALYLKFTQR